MPWKVENDNPDCDGYAVVVSEGPKAGDVAGCHDTREKAEAQQRALYANTDEKMSTRTFRYEP
jgi:hypothetical protein